MEEKAPGPLRTILWEHLARVEPLLSRRMPPAVAAAARTAGEKALRCGTPANGFIRYRCLICEAFHTRITCRSIHSTAIRLSGHRPGPRYLVT